MLFSSLLLQAKHTRKLSPNQVTFVKSLTVARGGSMTSPSGCGACRNSVTRRGLARKGVYLRNALRRSQLTGTTPTFNRGNRIFL